MRHGEVGDVAEATRAVGELPGLCPGESDKSLDVGRRQIRLYHQHRWPQRDVAQWREILAHVEGERLEEAGDGDRRVRHENGVAVRSGLGHDVGREIARGARTVVHDEGAAERIGELLGDDARRDVGAAAGLEADDDAHRLGRILLREGGCRRKHAGSECDTDCECPNSHASSRSLL
jgi:hypothetical protein